MILADSTETGQLKATAPKWTSAHLSANKASLDVAHGHCASVTRRLRLVVHGSGVFAESYKRMLKR